MALLVGLKYPGSLPGESGLVCPGFFSAGGWYAALAADPRGGHPKICCVLPCDSCSAEGGEAAGAVDGRGLSSRDNILSRYCGR